MTASVYPFGCEQITQRKKVNLNLMEMLIMG